MFFQFVHLLILSEVFFFPRVGTDTFRSRKAVCETSLRFTRVHLTLLQSFSNIYTQVFVNVIIET